MQYEYTYLSNFDKQPVRKRVSLRNYSDINDVL